MQKYRLKLVGIHMHIGSGVDYGHLEQVCGAMVRQCWNVVRIWTRFRQAADSRYLIVREKSPLIRAITMVCGTRRASKSPAIWDMRSNLRIEPGRFLVAQSGVLVTQVRSVKQMGSRHFVLVDAGFNDLMRPAMYGSYHRISALAADGRALENGPWVETVVAGPLCESGDVLRSRKGNG